MPQKGLVLMTGDPYTGKTFFALEMAVAVSQGLPFMGRYPAAQGPVLYVVEDPPDWDVMSQLRKLLRHHKDEEGHPLLRGRIEDFYFVLHDGANLDTDLAGKRIAETAKQVHASLVVLDSLRDFHNADENDSGQMKRVMHRIQTVREDGAAVLMIHHSGKPAEGRSGVHKARGSSAIAGKVDAHLHLAHYPRTGLTRLTVPKARALALPELNYTLAYDDDEAWFEPNDPSILTPDEKAVVDAYPEVGQEFRAKDAIQAVLGRHPQAKTASVRQLFYAAVLGLKDKGYVQKADAYGWYRRTKPKV